MHHTHLWRAVKLGKYRPRDEGRTASLPALCQARGGVTRAVEGLIFCRLASQKKRARRIRGHRNVVNKARLNLLYG